MKIKAIIPKLINQLNLDKTKIKPLPIEDMEIKISADQLLTAVGLLLDSGIWHLSTITCLQISDNLALLYHFWLYQGLTFRVELNCEDAKINSICPLIPGAEFYEREVHEMLGVEFIGSPNTKPLLLPDDWQGGYPMRKETKGSGKSHE